jgi:NAD(P)-dependent dehydrogenase (short-subunit alcohol dehydrogenase family)
MSSNRKIAIVTGANRGIGLEICRQLASQNLQVILTSRNPESGEAATKQLRSTGLDVTYFPLDVTQQPSVEQLASYIRKTFSRLDVLVNNAGVLYDSTSSVLDAPLATLEKTLGTNLFGSLRLCQALVPLMKARNYGRIVNVSSGAGQLFDMRSGYPTYRISKTALNSFTRILANELKGTHILVNAVCPGWVKTDMGGINAPRSVEEGADTAVWLATLPNDGPTGGFFRDRQPIPW